MKKRKINILLNIVLLCVCVCSIAFGVYSAKTASLNVGGTIGFNAHNCKVRVLGKITGAVDSSNNALPESTASLNYQESASTGKLIDGTSESWDFGKIYFDDLNVEGNGVATDIVFTFTLINESTYFDVIATLNVDKLPDSVQPNVAFSSDSNNSGYVCELKKDKTQVTITLKLKLLTKEQISSATKNINMTLSFEEVNKNQTASALGYTFSDGKISGVPATTKTNATLNIPSYFYDTTNGVAFVKSLDNDWSLITNVGEYYAISIPNSVTDMVGDSFADCSNIKTISIPYSITSLPDFAFNRCTGLTSITIPNSVSTGIVWSAFYGCTSLTSITIPKSITSIGLNAFSNCTSLKSVTMPDTVTKIAAQAFSGCTSLTSINIPDSVTSIDDFAFEDCTSLTTTIGDGWINSTTQEAVSPSTLLKDIDCNIIRQA